VTDYDLEAAWALILALSLGMLISVVYWTNP
jgi:hypothetical protein